MFESFLTKAGRFGNKVADAAVSGLKWGQKAAGNVVRYGTKGLDIAKHATSAIERTPFLGTAAAPLTGLMRSAIGVGENVMEGARRSSRQRQRHRHERGSDGRR